MCYTSFRTRHQDSLKQLQSYISEHLQKKRGFVKFHSSHQWNRHNILNDKLRENDRILANILTHYFSKRGSYSLEIYLKFLSFLSLDLWQNYIVAEIWTAAWILPLLLLNPKICLIFWTNFTRSLIDQITWVAQGWEFHITLGYVP